MKHDHFIVQSPATPAQQLLLLFHGVGDNPVAMGQIGSWFAPLSDAPSFAMIVSNPPYIDGTDPHLHEGDVRFEPRSALVAEEQGLADIRLIVTQAPAHLVPGGWLLLEHGWDQGEAVRQLLLQQGYVQVETVRD